MKYENLSTEEKKIYDRHQINLISERNVMETARLEGIEEGKEIGIEKGIKIEQEKRQAACQMKKDGLAVALIAKYTGLSVLDIEGLDC